MVEDKENKKKKSIAFGIADISKVNHWEKDPKIFDLTASNLKKAEMEMGVNIKFDADNGMIIFGIKVKLSHRTPEVDIDLFGIETLYKFKVKNFKKYFKTDKPNTWNIPDPFMANLLMIATCGTRGMLSVLNTNPAYKGHILPLINPIEFIKKFKGREKTE